MSTSMLGPVRCVHRWVGRGFLDYPRTPTAAGLDDAHMAADGEYAERLQLQVAVCARCGRARLRLFVDKTVVSSWSQYESVKDVLLGRELDEGERRRMLAGIVLN